MSLDLLKRELENDVEEFNAKKAKKGKKSDKPVKSVKQNDNKQRFEFNDWDYSVEEDYTDDCLKNLGVLDKKLASVQTDKIIAHNQKTKRQEDKILLDSGSKEEESIFTDADFEFVSQLNFVNSSKAYIVDDFTGDREYHDIIKDGKKRRVKKKKKDD